MDTRGISLIEVVVSILLLSLGLLGAASVLAFAVRAAADGTLGVRATALAAGQRETMVAGGCASVGPGVAPRSGIVISWSAGPGLAAGVRRLEIVAARRTATGVRADTVVALCAE